MIKVIIHKQEEKLKSAKRKNRHIGAERKARFPEAEESLKTWVLEFRMDGIAVTLNMPFKDKLREKWNIWMSLGQFTYNKGGNLRKPGYDCGISNAMDGSEDDLFGQDENGEEIDENEREIVGKL
ncbi:hypothetical protein RhiirC2_775391 [Rhizophagus irregularis]|uniref:HTH CENPB-type domain-containing protein n=1 Tax=Rhizophagus irregularis TaxID=588596 RepID=A0A2N1NJF9_9GLOM|nr:hypothetical protein RhiirC2_775391 [Rhizophagus irregularis]